MPTFDENAQGRAIQKIYKRIGLRRDQNFGDLSSPTRALENLLDKLIDDTENTFLATDLDAIANTFAEGLENSDYLKIANSSAEITDSEGETRSYDPRITYQNRLDKVKIYTGNPRLSGGDGLTVDGISYQFPIGDKTQVIVGDSIDGSSLFSTACVYGGFTNTLDDCGNGSSAITGPADNSVAASASYDIGGGWTAALGYAGEGSNNDGFMTKLGQDFYAGQVAYTADSYGISLTMANIESATHTSTAANEYFADTTYYAVNAYWTPEETGVVPSISVGFENGNVEADQSGTSDTNQWFVGFQWDEAGAGTLGAAIGSSGAQATDNTEDLNMYEVFYSYPVNDGMTITPAVYVQEQAVGFDDITGVMVKTSFSF